MVTSLITSLILTIYSLTGTQHQCNDHVNMSTGVRAKRVHAQKMRFFFIPTTTPHIYVF